MTLRRVVAVLAVWLPSVVVLLSWLSWRDELPAVLPTHWSSLTAPDDYTATPLVLAWIVPVVLGCGLVATVTAAGSAVSGRPGQNVLRIVLTVAAGAAGLVAGMWGCFVAAALDPASAAQGALTLLLPLVGMAWAGVPLWLLPGVYAAAAMDGDPTPALSLRPGQRAAWSTRIGSRWLALVGAVSLIPLVALAVTTSGWLWLVVVLVGLPFSAFADLEVDVDRRGLRVVAALWHLPFKRIALEDIEAVRAEHIDPMRWGGWGYRVLPGRSAVVLRAGPGLVVRYRGGKLFAITVPDPQAPAALLEAFLSQPGRGVSA